jgi:hypothetical protein
LARRFTVPCLIALHLQQNAATTAILRRQPIQMPLQVADHLALGLADETQAPGIARHAGQQADGIGAAIPQWGQAARFGIKFAQTLIAPIQMLIFFLRRLLQRAAHFIIAAHQGLTAVQCLRTDFARMIDAHQSCRLAPLPFSQPKVVVSHARMRLGSLGRRQYGTDRLVQVAHETIDQAIAPGIHG